MNNLFPVYSISKPFLAQAVLELNIPFDAEIGDYVAHLEAVFANKKVGELLNHTSGLSDYGQLKNYHDAVNRREEAWSRKQLLSECAALDNSRNGFHYSNVGYLLLRMLIENKTSKSYFGALNDLVFAPLGIQGFEQWEVASPLVSGYDPRWVYSGTFLADFETIQHGFLKLLKKRSSTLGVESHLVQVPYPNTGFDNPSYGLGLMVDNSATEDGSLFVGHGGGGPGFSHMLLARTGTWQAAIESSLEDFDQAQAILKLKNQLATKR